MLKRILGIGGDTAPAVSPIHRRSASGRNSSKGTEITALERRRNKTWAIKQSMMQQLLTGRVWLFVPQSGRRCDTAERGHKGSIGCIMAAPGGGW
jgi:hypothetical protein